MQVLRGSLRAVCRRAGGPGDGDRFERGAVVCGAPPREEDNGGDGGERGGCREREDGLFVHQELGAGVLAGFAAGEGAAARFMQITVDAAGR